MLRDTGALAETEFDVLVIGGGIHGAWIALAAARAGFSVALLERSDFGGATSSNSLKILHGGLRYLQHLDYPRMRKSVRARREFSRLSPGLVQPLPCLMPLRATGLRSPWVLGPALALNDLVGADRNSGVAETARLPRGRLVSRVEASRQLSHLTPESPYCGALWWDAVVTDTERMTMNVIAAAAAAGARVANRVHAERYLARKGGIAGVGATDLVSGRTFDVRARLTIAAAGPWVDALRVEGGPRLEVPPTRWIGAVNLVLRRSLGPNCAVALRAPAGSADPTAVLRRDARELFIVPWQGRSMVGTGYVADVDPDGRAMPEVRATAAQALLEDFAAAAPAAQVSMADVARVHWGLLPADPDGGELPRRSATIETRDRLGFDGLVRVVSEKYTSAPEVALQVVSIIRASLIEAHLASSSPGGSVRRAEDAAEGEAPRAPPARLHQRYGNALPDVLRHAQGRPELMRPLAPGCEVLRVEVVHAIRGEMALTLHDVVLRRVGLAGGGPPDPASLRACAQYAGEAACWNPDHIRSAVASLEAGWPHLSTADEPLFPQG